ncbi:MAG: NAD(+) diphosphatase [Acetobacteraceae bacterium]|nr:NAD(+) diphosphatase [Acetobacteraceae bacterium]
MSPIRARRSNPYTGSPLDRASALRDNPAAVAERLADPASLFVPVWRGQSLLAERPGGGRQAVLLRGEAAALLRGAGGGPEAPWALLGLWNGTACFALDLSAEADPLPLLPPGLGRFADLRAAAGLLPAKEAALLAHARGLMHWRGRQRFCGACGGPTAPRSAGNALLCEGCGTVHFPRTDPAVIMLVVRGEHCLLGHSGRFPNPRMYSALAGFVEPGESLEEAVRREVAEETGVIVGAVHYHSSQPWPFPASIMLGFHAEALSEEILPDPAELEDARWFHREALRDPESLGIVLPRADSIARRLIEDWLEAA